MNSKQYFDKVAYHWDKMREDFFSDQVKYKAFSLAGVQRGKNQHLRRFRGKMTCYIWPGFPTGQKILGFNVPFLDSIFFPSVRINMNVPGSLSGEFQTIL